jgi:hypothetical protein
MRVVDGIPGIFYGVGLICMLLNKRNKRLGDFVAGTVLVHDKKIESVSAVWNPGNPANHSLPADMQIAKISSEELLLIETYLNRRRELSATVRTRTAQQIIAMLKDKAGIERIEGQSDDALLEAIARKVRDSARYR